MTIRIWHQSFTVLEDLRTYEEALQAHFRKVARPDTIIETHGMRPGTFRTDYPGHDIKHAALQHFHGTQFLEAAVRAEREGADAYAISTLPEPALREARNLLSIPVVGYGESAMLTSCMLGQRFGVLLFIEGMADLVVSNAVRHGLSSRFGGAEFVGFGFQDVLEGFSRPGPLIDRFRTAARRMIDKGVDVIIPGEAPLNVLLAANGVTDVDGATVIDSLACWIKHAEMLVDLRRQCGTNRSQRGYFGSRPEAGRIDEILTFYNMAR
jgi:Asp/Glu/hydantoin racemase